MSYIELQHEIANIEQAGWLRDVSGFWAHPFVKGLQTLKSAIRITNSWGS